jgi:sugar (pentulose or hexulose) kinase
LKCIKQQFHQLVDNHCCAGWLVLCTGWLWWITEGGKASQDPHHGLLARPCPAAKLWCDTESAAEAEELSRLWGEAVVPAFTATKLLWLQRKEPEAWGRLAHVLLPHDYVNWWLTGRFCMEVWNVSYC